MVSFHLQSRLKYLLSQSDIFSHFGVGGGKAKADSSSSSSSSSSASAAGGKISRGRRSNNALNSLDEMDDDERAMAKAAGDDDEDAGEQPQATVLLRQPACISGGAMRSYQLEGLNWMIRLQDNGINGILADEMGLGKTLQSISILGYMHEFRKVSGPHLVMVPKSTLSNWMNEFKRWCPELRTVRFHGSKEERAEIVQDVLQPGVVHEKRGWDVVITTYEIVNMEKGPLTKIAWRYLIIDEAHRLKNEASQFSQTVRMLNTQSRLLLTGTPLQNNLHELWALLNFLLPDVFASAEQFDDWFNLDVDDTEAKQRIISQLHKILRPFMLRRLKVDVEKSLPLKSETILFTGMSTTQKNLYKQILLRDIDTINGTNGSRTAVLNIVMQLRKCCNHPYLFPGVEDRTLDPLGEHLYQSCGKMVLMDKLLKKMKERDHRVLVFSQMTRMLDILEDYFLSQGFEYCRIDGNTSYEDREDRIADYNREGSTKFIFLLSTRAGGLGINLQTADTVILYDSDWNPQADLQAQDRAHRIGQKKPVQVFRLVTDETVEVKVVERAQQKLKLDAMVVQQGRLQDKDKKMTKDDLLDTLRFGADKIFRTKDSTITDEDIDVILDKGRKRTEEMNEKLTSAEKGDMYDFRLDGGMSTQMFEGKDYSDRNLREAELNALACLPFIDPGKRERKAVASYAETIARMGVEDQDKKPKIPRHLRLPKMEDWQFYDRSRLNDMHNEELRLFDIMAEKGDLPGSNVGKLTVLPPEQHEEKLRLLSEAFGDWTRVHYNNFIRSAAKYGRSEFDKMAKDVGRPVDEVRRYSSVFWERGATIFPPAEWEKVVKQVEKGEKRLEEIQRLTSATAKLIGMFEDPWEELTFRNVGNQGKIFNAVEDRFLLCLTHLHGYGSWDMVRNSIRRCDRFRFDFYLQSCSAEALGKRCELLMRSAERELAEIERKKQAADAMNTGSSRPRTSADMNKERLAELTSQIASEGKRLGQLRTQLNKVKVPASGPAAAASSASAKSAGGGASAKELSAAAGAKKSASSVAESSGSGGVGGVGLGGGGPGSRALTVPDGLLPELCRMLRKAGPDGVNKVVNEFTALHPELSKRQTEIKIAEIALKVKTPEDVKQVWHIRPEFQHYLSMETFYDAKAAADAMAVSAVTGKGGKPGPKPTAPKRKREDDDDDDAGKGGKGGSTPGKEPKKAKHAFGFFVKARRAEAESQIGDNTVRAKANND